VAEPRTHPTLGRGPNEMPTRGSVLEPPLSALASYSSLRIGIIVDEQSFRVGQQSGRRQFSLWARSSNAMSAPIAASLPANRSAMGLGKPPEIVPNKRLTGGV
jgi:hypothetical protein